MLVSLALAVLAVVAVVTFPALDHTLPDSPRARFARVAVGMTEDQVSATLGQEPELIYENFDPPESSLRCWFIRDRTIEVSFSPESKVQAKWIDGPPASLLDRLRAWLPALLRR